MRHFPIDALLRVATALAALATIPALAAGPLPSSPAATATASMPVARPLPNAAQPAAATALPDHAAGAGKPPLSAAQRNRPKVVEHYVDLNSADRQELITLPGIGTAEADRIIANRPYLTKTELVTKQVLPVGPYLSLKNQVVAMQKFKTVPQDKGKVGP